ncbi:protein kinase [Dyella humicola]|uniref:protein kinase n=1 Tax=Dyella humicola TaxID=2992126 RepID=UPI002252A82B|nr:protein kinase [Dyella humicola]
MKLTRYGRMGQLQEQQIVQELARWGRGELGATLTWEHLEKQFGFSRQTLNQKSSIKAAYKLAKEALQGGLVRSRQETDDEIKALNQEIARLRLEIEQYKDREKQWKLRWQRVAFNIRKAGVQMFQVDRPVQDKRLPSATESAKVIQLFDGEIPPSGRV